MFRNIGRKIQITAKVFCWIGIVCSVVGGIFLIATGIMDLRFGAMYGIRAILMGVGTALLGSLLSWVSSFMMIGFGVLVERCEEIADNTRKTSY